MNKEEWYQIKADLADAFATLHFADSCTLSAEEVKNIQLCLKYLNDYLEADAPEEMKKLVQH